MTLHEPHIEKSTKSEAEELPIVTLRVGEDCRTAYAMNLGRREMLLVCLGPDREEIGCALLPPGVEVQLPDREL